MHVRVQDLLSSATISYAQNREDLILSGFFDESYKGFYVDVGANDADSDSVTRNFYDRGWHGINIEPIRSFHRKLEEVRPRDINLNLGVSNREDKLTFREYENHGRSTFSNEMKKEYEEHPDTLTEKFHEYTVEVRPLKDIFEEYSIKKIDFLKVDVEGYEYEVLDGNDWKKYRPAVICIESNHIVKDWRPLLKHNGYELAYFDGLNGYYVDKSQRKGLKEFSYVDAVVMREPIVSFALLPSLSKRVDELNEAFGKAQQRINEIEADSSGKDAQIRELERHIDSITPLRRHVKRQIRFWLARIDHAIIRRLSPAKPFTPPQVTVNKSDDLIEQAQAADQKAFTAYAHGGKPGVGYRLYMSFRKSAIKTLKSIIRKVRR